MHQEFEASGPQRVHVELQSGDVRVEAGEEPLIVIDVDGVDAGDLTVERTDDGLRVIGPRRAGFLSRDRGCRVRLRVPVDSDLSTRLGSAGIATRGRLGAVQLSTGSGDVEVDEARTASVKTGSGDIVLGTVAEDAELKAGSGDVRVLSVGRAARVVTGSGSVEIRDGNGALSVKSGSGDLVVSSAAGDTSLFTASGDLTVGRVAHGKVQLRNVSGDIRLGVPEGTPVWTDVSTTTGRVHSTLPPVGPPAEGQDHVEVRATSVSGDIYLVQA